jgi:amino acid transporter
MPFPKFNKQAIAKTLLATVLFAVLAGVAGSQLAPDVPLHTVLLYCAASAAALLFLLVLISVVTLTYRQFFLRIGATDPQWFWFSAEPPGLLKLREEAREASAPPQSIKSD